MAAWNIKIDWIDDEAKRLGCPVFSLWTACVFLRLREMEKAGKPTYPSLSAVRKSLVEMCEESKVKATAAKSVKKLVRVLNGKWEDVGGSTNQWFYAPNWKRTKGFEYGSLWYMLQRRTVRDTIRSCKSIDDLEALLALEVMQ